MFWLYNKFRVNMNMSGRSLDLTAVMTEAARFVVPLGRSPGKKTECVGYGEVCDMGEAGEAERDVVVLAGRLGVCAEARVA